MSRKLVLRINLIALIFASTIFLLSGCATTRYRLSPQEEKLLKIAIHKRVAVGRLKFDHLVEVIRSPLITKHSIFILSDEFVSPPARCAVVVSAEKKEAYTLRHPKSNDGFNRLMEEEHLSVATEEQATEIVRLYFSTMYPSPLSNQFFILEDPEDLIRVAWVSREDFETKYKPLVRPLQVSRQKDKFFAISLFTWDPNNGDLSEWKINLSTTGHLDASVKTIAKHIGFPRPPL